MGRVFKIGEARGGWKSDRDVHGVELMICGRAVTVRKSGPDGYTIHLTPQDRVEAATALLHDLRSVAEPVPARRPGVAWAALLLAAVVVGALLGAFLTATS